MNDQHLEDQIRKLRPAPLPPELRSRLCEEPPVELTRHPAHRVRWAIAAAVVATATLVFLVIPDNQPSEVIAEDDGYLSVVQQEAALVSTRTLETREYNGQLWDLVENRWREETVAMCSATTATIRSTEIRPELVWVPVEFL
jgi:hypothetical protein